MGFDDEKHNARAMREMGLHILSLHNGNCPKEELIALDHCVDPENKYRICDDIKGDCWCKLFLIRTNRDD